MAINRKALSKAILKLKDVTIMRGKASKASTHRKSDEELV